MKNQRLALFIFALSALYSVSADAQQTFWQRAKLDYMRMKCWPEPFQHVDRKLARDPFVIMKDNGWRTNNTLSDHFFHNEQHTLTRAGELKVRWIVTQAPIARRTVFVLRGETPDITETRLASVQEYLQKAVPEGAPPDVLLTDIVPPIGSGEYFDAIDRQFTSSVPSPRLAPSANASGGSGGGSN